jgi:hypothetical protein
MDVGNWNYCCKSRPATGWKRFVPLFAGLWFPITVIPAMTMGYFFLAGPYSFAAFALLGFVVYKLEDKQEAVAVTELHGLLSIYCLFILL